MKHNRTEGKIESASDLAAKMFDDIYQLSQDKAGVSRPAFSAMESETLDYLAAQARAEGLCVSEDAGKNLWFCVPEHIDTPTYTVIGSHVDSVPMGGNYDGLAGVIAGLMVLIEARRGHRHLNKAVKVLAMRGEESAWFGACYLGSKMLTGSLPESEFNAAHKGDGRALHSHLTELGIDTAPIGAQKPIYDLSRIDAYLELHIEQGPLLVERNLPAAVVTGIRGNFRYRDIHCIGQAGHSGAVPRAYRHDPVLAFAELMHRLDSTWQHLLNTGKDLVLTSGVVGTDPNSHAISRIPDEISFSLDVRSQDADTLEQMRDYLKDEMNDIARSRGVTFDAGAQVSVAPALMDATVVKDLAQVMDQVTGEAFKMASGGGHDAAVFAQAGVPSGMIFVRNRNGSHNPDEAMDIADFMVGVDILSTYMETAS